MLGAGLTYLGNNGFTTSLRVCHFGDAALVEDESAKKDSSTLVNFDTSYAFGSWESGLDVLNLLDAEDNNIAYFF